MRLLQVQIIKSIGKGDTLTNDIVLNKDDPNDLRVVFCTWFFVFLFCTWFFFCT